VRPDGIGQRKKILMKIDKVRNILSMLILVMLVSGCGNAAASLPGTQAPIASEQIADIIARYRQEIPQDMQTRHIPGLAIAIVDDQNVLWEEGFGYTDWDRKMPITPSTLFSIQSMSKSFTATAAMIAAQDGLVDLDAPITDYLPDFTVNSIFEEHPEQKMTMRILLSHTAGFPHDPTYGGNFDGLYGAPPYSFEKHIASISDTWLMFPVGSRYSYSNIGIDLAGYVLQVRSGMPFVQYVQKKIFDPLGMKDSTLDYLQVRANATRAIGQMEAPIRPPVDFQLIPSGGVWTSAEDMARYLRFHINKGTLGSSRLLREDLAETMYTPPNLPALGAYGDTGYAMGVTVDNRNNTRHFQHGGGGFGFNSSMVWYPDLKLGSVVLTNFPQPDGYCVELSEDVLESIMMSNIPLYHQRAISAVKIPPAYPFFRKPPVLSDADLKALIASKALSMGAAHQSAAQEDEAAKQRRNAAVGTYIATAWGFPVDKISIGETDGKLTWTYHGDMMISESTTLTEVQPGLFFSTEGNLVDLRGPIRLIDNVRLVKASPQVFAFRAAFYGLCGLVFLSSLFFFPIRAKIRRSQRKNAPAGILAGLTSLFSLFCLAIIAIIPNLIYIPWPLPYKDLAWWQFALVGLPFANLILAAGVILLAVLPLKGSTGARATRWDYLAVGLALLAFNGAILF
jgi:CubicO group peptidase (beta-lactamase class C family)